jgi:hypothetical protein
MYDNTFLNDASTKLTPVGAASNDNDGRTADRGTEPKFGKAASALFSEAAFNAPASQGPDLGKVLERGELARRGREL